MKHSSTLMKQTGTSSLNSRVIILGHFDQFVDRAVGHLVLFAFRLFGIVVERFQVGRFVVLRLEPVFGHPVRLVEQSLVGERVHETLFGRLSAD